MTVPDSAFVDTLIPVKESINIEDELGAEALAFGAHPIRVVEAEEAAIKC
jgi:hypothetical protein